MALVRPFPAGRDDRNHLSAASTTMNIDGRPWRTIWLEAGGRSVGVIDQTLLPHRFVTRSLATVDEAAEAIVTMVVRGAPLIGVTGAYGLMLALQADPSDAALAAAFARLDATRPTAINLRWALERVRAAVLPLAAGAARRGGRGRGGRHRRGGRGHVRGDRRPRPAPVPGDRRPRPEERRRPAPQRAHPLQRRLAGHGRLGHGPGADLQGAPLRPADPRLGRRDPAPQPGGQPDGLRAGPATACPTP